MRAADREQLREMRDELAAVRREQEWQRQLGVLAALMPYNGPRGRGWSNHRPTRIPLQRPALTPGERRVARAAPILAAHRAAYAIPAQREPLLIESRLDRRGASTPPKNDHWPEQVRAADGRFIARGDIQNNRNPRGYS